jgi:hypothetical protein
MATKNIVPRADNEGQLGTSAKKWNKVIATDLTLGTQAVSQAGKDLMDDANAAAQLATLGTAAYSEGTWTPVLVGFTVVGTAPVLTGVYAKIGHLVYVTLNIAAGSGGNTSVACSGGGTSTITGLPFAMGTFGAGGALICVGGSADNLGIGITQGSTMYPPTISTCTHQILMTAMYYSA